MYKTLYKNNINTKRLTPYEHLNNVPVTFAAEFDIPCVTFLTSAPTFPS